MLHLTVHLCLIIFGFSYETDEQFNETFNILQQFQFDVINISRYSARPKTLAAAFPQHNGRIIAGRSKRLTQLFESLLPSINQKWIGWQGVILNPDFSKKQNPTILG